MKIKRRMRLEKFLEFNRNSIEYDITQNPTTFFTVDGFIQAFVESINQLKLVRDSGKLTNLSVKHVFNKYKKKQIYGCYVSEDGSVVDSDIRCETTAEYNLIKLWLFKFCDQNDSFYHAYNAIVPYYNENGFPVDLKSMSDEELFNAIESDNEPILIKKKLNQFGIDTTLLHKVYEVCTDDTFVCSEADFIQCVENADFSNLIINKTANTMFLVYQLSLSMGDDWYIKAISSKGWTKGKCSGANVTEAYRTALKGITVQ